MTLIIQIIPASLGERGAADGFVPKQAAKQMRRSCAAAAGGIRAMGFAGGRRDRDSGRGRDTSRGFGYLQVGEAEAAAALGSRGRRES